MSFASQLHVMLHPALLVHSLPQQAQPHPLRQSPAPDRNGQHPAPCTPQSGGLSGRLAIPSPLTQGAQEGLRLAKKPTFESDSEDVVGVVSVSSRSLAVRHCVLDSLGSVLSEQ